ncbi:cytosolic phospholipase A2-like [Dendronephthya gigantea]|uniref:cytosolic phospholipase A2-like n=1 Tax=Dendronephthya gigantea TaxID=151771 RepID=UPI00106C36B9|nr:cytosolic phospholipase A2-like [Dendronephthya gigantea]
MERYEVKQEKIKKLTVKVIGARGVTVGKWSDRVDTPDPYVMLRVRTSPNAKQKTTTKKNDVNPVWNQSFTFYLNPERRNILELIMMDEDFGFDDKVGREEVKIDHLQVGESKVETIDFRKNKNKNKSAENKKQTTLDIELSVTYDDTRELRLSYDLCEEEKDFLKKRKEIILESIQKIYSEKEEPSYDLQDGNREDFLQEPNEKKRKAIPKIRDGKEAPASVNQVPTIAIMGSGGGYRAVCGLAGVFCALQEGGILDCATYVTGLSGSSWYISSLYAREGWPDHWSCEDMAKDLQKRFDTKIHSHFDLFDIRRFLGRKADTGQLVRFTDVFGMVIGDALLTSQVSKLSYQTQKVKHGELPLPITTGIRVRKDLPAAEFNEWVEFSPFEYGIAKYGVFGKTGEFGGKYYKGSLVKKYEEAPLHYLQGIWGSAFSIILNTLKDRNKKSEEETKKVVLKETGQLKAEDDDSEDEDYDEFNDEGWIRQMFNPWNIKSNRRGKAAETFNILRGLRFKRSQDADFDDAPGKDKTMCIVDSGIAFNSPYPAMLRPERKVEIILSFEFSDREGGDKELPFKELLKAEEWAKDHGLPFPQIRGNPVTEDPDIRECYVFENKEDVKCPTILHFPLVNKTFRSCYVKPGTFCDTEEARDFAKFDIFDDPEDPYSTFEFQYEERAFDRLKEMMRFNTLLNMDLIKEKIAEQVTFRKNNPHLA